VGAGYEGREVAAVLEPGDVVFFGGRALHRSHANRSPSRVAEERPVCLRIVAEMIA
jgi:ectoine hydroxylase-related dioxygenase (phytanoyl-CoA dioxygenase family)